MANMTHNQTVPHRKIYVKDLNPYITCNLCNGYLIEATTLVDCLHVFCRACILRYFENSKMGCPMCNTVYKKKNFPCFRPDPIMQSLVYKLVPGLYSKEVQRRDDFYRSTAIRASSSCSEDSVIGDLSQEHEEWFQYFSPDDSVSLSLEYYQSHLDQNANHEDDPTQMRTSTSSIQSVTEPNVINKLIVSDSRTNGSKTGEVVVISKVECSNKEDSQEETMTIADAMPKIEDVYTKTDTCESDIDRRRDRRYLQCPAAVTMSHLQKFVRMKYALSLEHKVDIIYNGEVLPQYFSLMDVAYTFKWQRLKPMQFYYRIFTPIRIKIVKTTSNGEKQLQVAPLNQNNPNDHEKDASFDKDCKIDTEAEVQNNINKENLLAQLNLKSKAKIEQEQQQASANSKNLSLKTMNPKALIVGPKVANPKSKDLKDLKNINIKETYSGVSNSKITNTKTPREVTLKVAPVKIETKSFIPSENSVKIDRVKRIYEPDDIDQKLSKLYENHKESKKLDQMKSPKHTDHNNHYGNKDLKLIYSKANSVESKSPRGSEDNCVYEYEERDEDELRKFAEKRDREWALQKQKDEEEEKYRSSKKRKKSKHSKNDFAHKKRKLHAEITSNESLHKEEPLKLKVKLTPHNGHKHKHHKNYQNNSSLSEPTSPKLSSELSSKEKLLQMRQVRHKNIMMEKDKQRDQDIPYSSESNVSDKSTQSENKDKDPEPKVTFNTKPTTSETIEKKVYVNKNPLPPNKTMETSGTQTVNNNNNNNNNKMKDISAGTAKNDTMITSKTLRSDFPIKTNASQELSATRYPTVQLERHEQAEKHVQKTYLKTYQSYTEKLAESVAHKADMSKMMFQNRISQSQSQSSTHNHKSPLERKIANLHQQYNAENKPKPAQQPPTINKSDKGKLSVPEKPQTILNSQYQTGFTVSKIEAGTKGKLEAVDDEQDKRPSLEITLINPPVTINSPSQMQKSKFTASEPKPGMKRPPPATIPLERIKKSNNLKSGISIIPKIPESQGPLDLSNPSKHPELFLNRPNGSPKVQQPISSPKNATVPQERAKTTTSDKNIQLSNLQMLSKVALEHSNINKSPVPTLLNISKKPPMPTLQTIKIPMPNQQNITATKSPNLARLPKLTEINKSTFRMMNPQMRNMRPNQNQNIRSIPNPSLLVRQQNQNRLNSMSSTQHGNGENSEDSSKTNTTENNKNADRNEKKNDEEKKEKEQKPDNTEKNNSETNAPTIDDNNKATS